jgi:uncharacterized protein YjbI with pentapeptide repeats
MSESGKTSTPPVWPQLMRLDKAATKPPPSWQEWKKLYGFWGWVLWPEWAAEWVVYLSRNWDFVKALELAGRFTILIVAVTWFLEFDDRERAREDAKKAKHYRAWELINSARDSAGDGGRRDALQDLNGDKVFLNAAPLSKAYLRRVELPGARLSEANLSEANLSFANLRGADLTEAILRGADLSRAILRGANLSRATLGGADLSFARLSEANLSFANLTEAILRGVRLRGANLTEADLSGADLSGADLSRATLRGADLSGADLGGARLSFANLTEATLRGANLRGANLSEAGADLSRAIVGSFPLERPLEWLLPGWEVFDDKGTARLRRSGAPSIPP